MEPKVKYHLMVKESGVKDLPVAFSDRTSGIGIYSFYYLLGNKLLRTDGIVKY